MPAQNRKFDPAIVRELLDYHDGLLIWKTRARSWFASDWAWKVWNIRYPGTPAGYLKNNGYFVVRLSILGFDSSFAASHLVWVWNYGKWPVDQLDHIDQNPGNNRIENLREVTNAENARNKSLAKSKSSRRFGIAKDEWTSVWRAQISARGSNVILGTFATEAEALAARKAAEILLDYHPNHGRLPSSDDPLMDPAPRGEWEVLVQRSAH